jgi:hypothetical protein
MEIYRIRLIRFNWPGENSIHKNNDLALELPRKSVKHSSWKKLSYCLKL